MDSDSNFYGDKPTVSSLNKRVASLDLPASQHAFNAAVTPPAARQDMTASSHPPVELHNSCQNLRGARQLSETVDEFLTRLPPATTDLHISGIDWLWMASPYAPPEPRPNQDLFKQEGFERLRQFGDFMQATKEEHAADRSPIKYNKKIKAERIAVVADLKNLAMASGMLSGKWMLFPKPGEVNRVWGVVAHATANGELGPVAKVSTRNAAEPEEQRLICVYTKDFRDKVDVARVLRRLRQLELAREGSKTIFYKSDAWTHVELYNRNKWDIEASMCSSRDMFRYIKDRGLKWAV